MEGNGYVLCTGDVHYKSDIPTMNLLFVFVLHIRRWIMDCYCLCVIHIQSDAILHIFVGYS